MEAINMNQQTRNKIVIIVVIVAFLGIIAAGIVASLLAKQADENTKGSAYIDNIQDCSANIDSSTLTTLRTQAYNLVTYANNYNKVASLPSYTSTIRKGSCKTTAVPTNSDGSGAGVESTSIILDIPAAKQSWQFDYEWVANGTTTDTDLGIPEPSCVPTNQLIYGDFNCAKILNLMNYGTDIINPIEQYMPYSGAGFALTYDPNTQQVDAQIQVDEEDQNNQTLIDNLKGQVVEWFSDHSLDINSYKVVYSTTVVPIPIN